MPREDRIAEEEKKAKDGYQLQRMRLDRLLNNIDRPVVIPARPEPLQAPKPPPEFVRNVVGSSAAAGSAEFHIYRNNRRKEQNRLDYIEKKAKIEEADAEYREKRQLIEAEEEERTAKRRAKRLRKKETAKKARVNAKKGKKAESDSESDSDSDGEDEERSEVDGGTGEREQERREGEGGKGEVEEDEGSKEEE